MYIFKTDVWCFYQYNSAVCSNFTKFCSCRAALVRVTGWCLDDDQSLPEPMLTKIWYALCRHRSQFDVIHYKVNLHADSRANKEIFDINLNIFFAFASKFYDSNILHSFIHTQKIDIIYCSLHLCCFTQAYSLTTIYIYYLRDLHIWVYVQ